jgi:transcriptional regulator with XRE-family HTH domain
MTMKTQNRCSDLSAEAIKTLRKKWDLSQQELATLLGVGIATVSRWERGTPPTGTAAAVLRVVIASSVFGLRGTSMTGGTGYAIYCMLKEVFERDQDNTHLSLEGH